MSPLHTVQLRVRPRSSRDEIVGPDATGRLIVRIKASPVDNAANDSLIRMFAKACGTTQGKVRIVRGARSRDKMLEVECEADALARATGSR